MSKVINGMYYSSEPDFKALFAEQEKNIIQFLEEQYENEKNPVCYHNEYFKRAIEKIFKEKNYSLFGGVDTNYSVYIEMALMKYGSFEYINQNFESKDWIFAKIDKMAMDMQEALLSQANDLINSNGYLHFPEEMNNIMETFENYIKNFFPQRLSYYTTNESFDNYILKMEELYDCLMKFVDNRLIGITDGLLDVRNLYGLNSICQLIDIRQQLKAGGQTEEKTLELIKKMDELTSEGILRWDMIPAVLNFSYPFCTKTINDAVDQIACRVQTLEDDDVSDIVNYVCIMLSSVKQNIELNYSQNYLYISKLLQIEYLEVLPPEEQERVKQLLDYVLERDKTILPDIEPIYKKIINGEEVTPEEYKEFYDGSFKYLEKDGIMPERYAETLFACMLDRNSYLGKTLDVGQMEIIVENLIRTKAERYLGNKSYISYASQRIYNSQVGTHLNGYMQVKHMPSESLYMSQILDLATGIHEIRHEKQRINEDNEEYNALAYLMKKEEILRSEVEEFYHTNYSNLYFELDAESFSLETVIHFLETLKPRGFAQMPEYKPIMKHLKERKADFDNRFKTANDKTIKQKDPKEDKIIKLQELFDDLVAKKPSIIKENPILETEYNPDGTRKPLMQIFEEFISKMKEGDDRSCTFSLYKYVLLTRVSDNVKDIEDVSDIKVPEDLPQSTQKAISTLKKAVLSRCADRLLGIDEEVDARE